MVELGNTFIVIPVAEEKVDLEEVVVLIIIIQMDQEQVVEAIVVVE